jgi:hypothetical protein
MQYSTTSCIRLLWHGLPLRMHLLAVFCFLTLTVVGQAPEVRVGWAVRPPVVYGGSWQREWGHRRGGLRRGGCWSAGWQYVRGTWHVALLRSGLLLGLWWAAGRPGAWWWMLLPWLAWLGQGSGVLWPGLVRAPEWQLGQRAVRLGVQVAFWAYTGVIVGQGVRRLAESAGRATGDGGGLAGIPLWAGAVVVVHQPKEERYQVTIEGHFTLAVGTDDPFRVRLLALFLLLLEDPAEERGGRRTRDGRRPVVRQEYLAGVLGLPHPVLSRWQGYWLKRDWRRLLSQRTPELLTLEVQEQIINTWAHWPSWGPGEVHRLLVQQGLMVSESQVRQAAEESGWEIVRQALGRLCVQRGEELRLREGWLLGELLAQVELLLTRVESGEGLAREEQLDLAAWRETAQEVRVEARRPAEAQPWLRRVEPVLLASGAQDVATGVHCPACGSTQVGRKGNKPRLKRFIDAGGIEQKVEVYRYRCHNPLCARDSFTLYPPGLLPYSPQRLEVHVLALQMYAWG